MLTGYIYTSLDYPALPPNDYKPDFILCDLFLHCLPADGCSHLLQEKVSDPRALALKTDKLFQSRVFSPVNLLADLLDEYCFYLFPSYKACSPG